MWPASSTLLARTIPSSADWPVPWRSLSARSVRASLTASTGQRSSPACSSRRSRTSPVVVSSVPPISSSSASPPTACAVIEQVGAVVDRHLRRAPRAARGRGRRRCRGPRRGSPGPRRRRRARAPPRRRPASTAGSPSTARRRAPPAISVRTRFAVSAVTCRHAATRIPSSGRSAANRSRICASTGICSRPTRSEPRPRGRGRDRLCRAAGSACRPPVRLTSSGSGPACTARRPARRGTRPARSVSSVSFTPSASRCSRATFSSRCFGQRVHPPLVDLGVAEQLDLRDHLVGERVRHHEARVAGRVAEVQQPALGQHDDRVAVGEHPLVDLRLDVDPLDARRSSPGRPCRSRCRSGRCCRRSPGASSAPCARR